MPKDKEHKKYRYRLYSYIERSEGLIAQSENLEFLQTKKRLIDTRFSEKGTMHKEGKVFLDSDTYDPSKVVLEESTEEGWKTIC